MARYWQFIRVHLVSYIFIDYHNGRIKGLSGDGPLILVGPTSLAQLSGSQISGSQISGPTTNTPVPALAAQTIHSSAHASYPTHLFGEEALCRSTKCEKHADRARDTRDTTQANKAKRGVQHKHKSSSPERQRKSFLIMFGMFLSRLELPSKSGCTKNSSV